MANLYADGNYSTAFLVSNVVSYPFPWPNNSTVAQFDLEYVQWANNYTAATLDSASNDAPSAFLVQQGPLRKIAPGIVRYARTYIQVPQTWGETQQVAYTYPGLSFGSGSNWNPYYFRSPITLYRIATVTHVFSHGATAPTLDNTFQVTDQGNVVDYIGASNPNLGIGTTSPASEPAAYTVSSASRLLAGLIWEKVTMNVAPP